MKSRKYQTVGRVTNLMEKIVEIEAKSIPVTRIFMFSHFLGLGQAFQQKWRG